MRVSISRLRRIAQQFPNLRRNSLLDRKSRMQRIPPKILLIPNAGLVKCDGISIYLSRKSKTKTNGPGKLSSDFAWEVRIRKCDKRGSLSFRVTPSPMNPSLLFVSSKLYEEAVSILYGVNTFHFKRREGWANFICFIRRLTPISIDSILKLTFDFPDLGRVKYQEATL